MNSHPLVTIITPCLNGQPFLSQAIESVLSQDYPRIEYLVVDGGSTDGTFEVLKSYGERIRWVSEPDRGQSQALNKGFRMAQGEIVAWINADDILLPGAVSTAVAAFAKDPELGMVYGEGHILEADGAVRCRFPYSEPFDLWRLVHYWDPILQQSAFLRAGAVKAVGGADESLHWGLDWDLFIRLAKRFPVQRLEAEMGAIRDHPRAKTAQGGFRRWRELAGISYRHAGRRITPASIIFGLDAFHKEVSVRFDPSAGRAAALAGRGLLFAHGLASHFLWPYLHDSQGWFEDGWAGPAVHLAFPLYSGEAHLEIEGSLPHEPAPMQTLDIEVNGTVTVRRHLPPGRFHLREPLPRNAGRGDMLKVELRSCYELERVLLVTSSRELVCTPPRVFG
jgi:hypothetical protein